MRHAEWFWVVWGLWKFVFGAILKSQFSELKLQRSDDDGIAEYVLYRLLLKEAVESQSEIKLNDV